MRVATSDWLYSALDQISLDSEQPAWSRDGWSFAQVDDVRSLPPVRNFSASGASNAQLAAGVLLVSTTNLTLTTVALRARLECSNVDTKSTPWFTKNEVDLFSTIENSTEAKAVTDRLNRTGYILPGTIFGNSSRQTSVFSRTSTVICCSNETDPAGRSAVGPNIRQLWLERLWTSHMAAKFRN
jgi:hypothetical protein